MQIYNLLKVLNKNKPLEDLNNINEVYENPVEMIEEIYYYNKIKGNKNTIKTHNSVEIKLNEKNIEEEEENFDPSEYINEMKKKIM